MEDMVVEIGSDRVDPLDRWTGAWDDSLIKEIKEVIKPDIVVSDMLARGALKAADDLNVPCVVNNPAGPYKMY